MNIVVQAHKLNVSRRRLACTIARRQRETDRELARQNILSGTVEWVEEIGGQVIVSWIREPETPGLLYGEFLGHGASPNFLWGAGYD